MMLSGYRFSQQIREWDQGLYCSSLQLYSLMTSGSFFPSFLKTTGASIVENRLQHQRIVTSCTSDFVGCLQGKSPRQIPITSSDCFSQREDDNELLSEGLSPLTGGIIALGKFDALHIGHRELAIQASKVGAPFLLSFVGMGEVLGWEIRLPIVAKCDRKRVLSSWAPYCGNVTPAEFHVEFSTVRHLSPRQFVEKLSNELGVSGVVAGENYRFGYRASGDAVELVRLCDENGIKAYIINSVMDKNQELARNISSSDSTERGQVSSTRVRHALGKGNMRYVSELLGRKHRLLLMAKYQDDEEGITSSKHRLTVPRSYLLNLPPKEGSYCNCFIVIGEENLVSCRVIIDTTHIHLESDEVGPWVDATSQELWTLGIEFGDTGV